MTERAPAPHAPILGFDTADGCLTVGGQPLTRLAARAGGTPFYVYGRDRMDARIAALRQAVPPSLRISYAVKANPMPAVVQHLAQRVDGFDVASAGELLTALDTPVPAGSISFAGPAKQPRELEQAAAAGVVIHAESERELGILAACGRRLGVRPQVALRVNPDFQLKGAGMHMGGGAQQFGIDADRIPAVLGRIGSMDLDFLGFHIFAGSQNLDERALSDAQEATVDLAIRLAADAPQPVRHLNIGGGFGIPYTPGERHLDLAAVGRSLAEHVERAESALPGVRVVLELGRYLVGEAGIYVCRVVDRKESAGSVFLVTDGGLHHNLAATGNLGQVIRRNFPVAAATRMDAADTETVTITGPLCTPLDRLATAVPMPRCEPGDLIAVFQSGAYGASASPQGFLSHPPPAEILV